MTATTRRRPRVLLVENDTLARELTAENLAYWGYEVIVAEGQGDELIADAKQKARERRCLLAVVDVRLYSDGNPNDDSGINLAKELRPAESLLLSSYRWDRATTRRFIEEGFKTAGKEEGPEVLREVLAAMTARSYSQFAPHTLDWGFGLTPDVILKHLFGEETTVPSDQVEALLLRLYPESEVLSIVRLENNYPSPTVFHAAPRSRSFVVKVYQDNDLQPDVVKISQTNIINEEVKRYRNHIRGKMLGATYTQLQEPPIFLWDIAGVRYHFLGAMGVTEALPSFRQVYQSNSATIEEITTPLHYLFTRLWGHYYSTQMSAPSDSLFEAYTVVWSDRWHERLLTRVQDARDLTYPFLPEYELPHPVRWVCRRVGLGEEGQAGDASRIRGTKQALTHGDLHGDNLFVDGERCWVIDYERTGPGPVLQDFLELEVNILTRLARFEDAEMATFCHLLVTLLAPSDLRIPASYSFSHTEADKALGVIRALRDLSWEVVGQFDPREYLWGLLLNCAFRASLEVLHQPGTESDLERTLLLGGLICSRLHEGATGWKPAKLFPAPVKADEDVTLQRIPELRDKMTRYFNMDELRELAQDIGVDFDEFGQANRKQTTAEMIQYLQRRGRLRPLQEHLKRLRPKVRWDDFFIPASD